MHTRPCAQSGFERRVRSHSTLAREAVRIRQVVRAERTCEARGGPRWPAGDGEGPRGAGTDGRRPPWYDVDVRGRQMGRREDGAKTRKCARFGWRSLLDLRVYSKNWTDEQR
jgi:hypothetical protein